MIDGILISFFEDHLAVRSSAIFIAVTAHPPTPEKSSEVNSPHKLTVEPLDSEGDGKLAEKRLYVSLSHIGLGIHPVDTINNSR
jgi:hypothetical protein